MKTVETHRQEIDAALMNGGRLCLCCNRWAEAHRYPINSGMARSLLWIVREFEKTGDWIEVQKKAPRFVLNSNSHGKLLHWNLVQRKPNKKDPTKHYSGIYKPTHLGIEFAHNRVVVPKYKWIYDKRVLATDDSIHVTIRECFPLKFNFEELMRNIFGHSTDPK